MIETNINRFINWKIFLFFFVYGNFVAISKNSALVFGLNIFEFYAEMIGSVHFIMYLLIPVFFLLVMNLLMEQNLFAIIRLGKYRNYFICKCITYFLLSAIFVFCLSIMIIIIGFGLPIRNEFVETLNNVNVFDASLYVEQIGNNPLIVCLLQTAYLIIGLTFLAIVLEVIAHFFSRKIFFIVLGLNYVLSLFSINNRLDIDIAPFLISTYTILPIKFSDIIPTLISVLTVCVILLVIVSKFWHKKAISFHRFISICFGSWNIRNLIHWRFFAATFILITMVNIILLSRANISYFSEFIHFPLLGYGYGYFFILDFILLLVVMGLPVFFLSVFLEETFKNNSCFVRVRYSSRLLYMGEMLKNLAIFTLSYVVLLFVTTFIGSLVVATVGRLYLYSENYGFFSMVFSGINMQALILKYLEIYMTLLLTLSITLYVKKATISFIFIICGYMLNIISFNIIRYNPFGISSIMRWAINSNYDVSFGNAFLILCCSNLILVIYLTLYGKKYII